MERVRKPLGAQVAVTIRDVARTAQVSMSTVSRAFTMPELVREQTRRRVLDAARELGYRPNRAARGLITGQTGNVGVVVPDLTNPFFPSVLQGAQARAQEADYAVFLADTGEDPRNEVELIQTMAKQVDGVVICSSRLSRGQVDDIVGLTPLVFLNRRVRGVPAVLMDSADGMRQAVDHLAALGHRRCAYLSGPRRSWSNEDRRRGLRKAAKDHDMDVVELGPFAPWYEAGMQAADLALAADVTAILAFNDLMAVGVLTRLADRGVAVPEEMSVLGFDDIAMAGMCTPPLTTIAMPKKKSGRAAVDLLLSLLAASDTDVEGWRALPTQLIVRSSTAPPRGAPRRPSRSRGEGSRP